MAPSATNADVALAQVASASADHSVCIWDLTTGMVHAKLLGHEQSGQGHKYEVCVIDAVVAPGRATDGLPMRIGARCLLRDRGTDRLRLAR